MKCYRITATFFINAENESTAESLLRGTEITSNEYYSHHYIEEETDWDEDYNDEE